MDRTQWMYYPMNTIQWIPSNEYPQIDSIRRLCNPMHQRASPSCHRAIGTLSLALINSIKHTHTWRWAGGTLQRIVCLLVISFAVWKIVGISVIENHKVFQSILNPVNCIGLQWVQINRAILFYSSLRLFSSILRCFYSILPFDSSLRLFSSTLFFLVHERNNGPYS